MTRADPSSSSLITLCLALRVIFRRIFTFIVDLVHVFLFFILWMGLRFHFFVDAWFTLRILIVFNTTSCLLLGFPFRPQVV